MNEREPNRMSAETLVDAWRRVCADRHTGAMGGMKLPRVILFDLDATTLVAFGPAKS